MDNQMQRIREHANDLRRLRECLAELPHIQKLRDDKKRRVAIDQLIRKANKNGLSACGASKAADGVWYCHVDGFIKWLDQGMVA